MDQSTATVPFDSLKAFVKFGVDAGNALGKTMDAGSGLNLSELEDLFGLVAEGKTALAHLADMQLALKSLTDQQRTDLYAYVMTNLNMPETAMQAVIEKAMLTVCKLHEIYLLWK